MINTVFGCEMKPYPRWIQKYSLKWTMCAVAVGILTYLLAFNAPAPASAAITSTPTGDMQEPRIGHSATALRDGTVLVVGGIRNGGQATAEIYDPASNTWTQVGSLNQPRGNHTATLMPDGKVLISGGYFQTEPLQSTEIYDPATRSWQLSGNMNVARDEHAMTIFSDSRILVTGGYAPDGSALNSAELYNPTLGAWELVAARMTVSRYDHTASLLTDGRVLLAGGLTDDPVNGEVAVEGAELFDPATGLFKQSGSMRDARYAHTATVLQSGKVFVTGGHNGVSQLATTELYDPATSSWQPTASLNTARRGHTASLVVGDALLLIGGLDNTGRLAKNEIFDPANNIWKQTGDLNIARNGHTSTPLSRQIILVAGGSTTNGATLSSVELYDPGVELAEEPTAPDKTNPDPQPNPPQERTYENGMYIPLIQR